MIILDTDTLSGLMSADAAVIGWLDRQPQTSVWTTAVSVFEVRFSLMTMPIGRRQSLMLAAFDRAIDEGLEGRILLFDRQAAEHAALLTVRRKSAGRPIDLRDTMIGGIALAQRATIATRNLRTFSDLDVPLVDPWSQ
jgi:predicted nucleic acid-binding protein